MEENEFEQLETLLEKLEIHLGHRYCIIPNCIHEGFNIGIYHTDGVFKDQLTSDTIKSTADKLIERYPKK